MERNRKRNPVRTQTCDEDDTLRLAQLLRRIERRANQYHSRELVRRAFAFNGRFTSVREADLVPKP